MFQTVSDWLLGAEVVVAIALVAWIAGRFVWNLKTPRRVERVRIARWFYVYLYAALGAMVVALTAPWLRRTLTAWFHEGPLPTEGSLALVVIVVAAFVLMLRARPVAIGELKTSLCFPPWWVSVLLAQVFMGAYWWVFPSTFSSLIPEDYGALGPSAVVFGMLVMTGLLLVGLMIWDRFREGDESGSADSRATDLPIKTAADDDFGHTAIAKRIALRLSTDKELPSVAVIGPFGSGKTSIRYLTVEELAKKNRSVIVVPVSAWPYESAATLVTGVLERVVAKLADIGGWEALRHVPAAYREAVEGTAGSWGKLLRVLERPRTPDDVLREIDDVAMALRVRVVVWVEDLERFAPIPDDQPETPEVREKLEPVRALLHQLQELRYVTIVVATTRLESGFDLEKLARFIEVIPSISPELTLAQLHKVRLEAMKSFASDDVVDAVPFECREKFDLQPDSLTLARQREVARARKGALFYWADGLCALSPTPRSLKEGLREFFDTWRAGLCGEVDIDHALGASILRHAHPKGFQTAVDHRDYLRAQKQAQWFRRRNADSPSDLEVFLMKQGIQDEKRQAVAILLQYLFGPGSNEHPQGFGQFKPTDYWARFLARSVDDTARDQPVLNALQRFISDGSGPLVELSMRPNVGQKLLAFESLLPTSKVLDLLDAQIRWVQEAPVANYQPIIYTRHIYTRRAGERNGLPDRLFRIIEKHMLSSMRSHDLRLADWLLMAFETRVSDDLPNLLPEQQRDELRRKFVDAFVASFRDDPQALVKALEAADDPWLLHRSCYGLHQSREGANGIPFGDWSEFSKTLMTAAESNPKVLLPQLVYFVTKRARPERNVKAKFDYDAMEELLGKELLGLFDQNPDVDSEDPETQARLAAARATSSTESSRANEG